MVRQYMKLEQKVTGKLKYEPLAYIMQKSLGYGFLLFTHYMTLYSRLNQPTWFR